MDVKINSKGIVDGIDTTHGTVLLLLPDGSLTIQKIKSLVITI